jgi:uncharacterized protein
VHGRTFSLEKEIHLMIFEGVFQVSAPRQQVWDFLLDIKRVSECVPGAEDVREESDGQYSLVVKSKVAFLTASVKLRVSILEADPPSILKSVFQGADSRLGSTMKQSNIMELVELGPATTEVRYRSDVSFMGKLGTLGRPLIQAKANQLMKEFSLTVRSRIESSTSNDETGQGGQG